MSTTLGSIVEALGGQLRGNDSVHIERIAPLALAGEGAISFVSNPRYLAQARTCQASALIVTEAVATELLSPPQPWDAGAFVVVPDPYLYYARLSQWWKQHHTAAPQRVVSPKASVDPAAKLGERVSVGDFAVIEAGADIGDDAIIGAHCVIGAGAKVGERTRLAPRVTLGFDCTIGSDGIIHSGVVIGADGFGFAPHQGHWVKIEQLGAVHIGHHVEIGANTCIDRGALGDTVIEDGVKLDNLIQIGHNVRVGAHTAMAGCVGVAGSADIGRHCMIGGGAVVLGHLTVADKVTISASSTVTRSIKQPGMYTGVFPLDDNAAWEKNAVSLKQLSRLRERVRALEAQLASSAHTDNKVSDSR